MRPPDARDGISEALLDRDRAESVLADLALVLLSPTPPPGQIVIAGERDADQQSVGERLESAVLLIDSRGTILAFGGEAERVFDQRAAEVVGKDASAILNVSGEELGALAREPDRAPGEVASRLRGRRRDGTEFPIAFQASTLTLGRRRLVFLFVEDVGQRRRRDAAKSKAEMRHRLLIEQIPAVTFIAAMDEGPNEIYVSPQIESLIGFSQREWLENPILWFSQLHADDREILNREFARGIATGGPFRAEVRVFAKDGHLVWVRGEGRLVRDQNGRPLFFQGIAFDVTESKRAAEQLHDAQEMKIRNERLAAIGQIAASISHDLRNPLGAIRNAWFYIQRRLAGSALAASDPRISRFSELIDRDLTRCNNIIGDLLDFTRHLPPTRSPCAIDALVQEVFRAVANPSRNIRLVSQVPSDLPVAYLDADQMEQVLINLVQNAADAVDPKTGWVSVFARVDEGMLVIEVTDNGPGFPADVADKIFEPLFTTKTRGTGLGLAIVRNIVRAHGGEVSAETDSNRTTFRIRVPMAGDAALSEAKSTAE
jgi:PAS domain S-box-containing protein